MVKSVLAESGVRRLVAASIVWLTLSNLNAQTPPGNVDERAKSPAASSNLSVRIPPRDGTNAPPSDSSPTNQPSVSTSQSKTNDPISRIRQEGLEHSQVMDTLKYLTDVIGPRLTGSPNLNRANEWTREKLSGWGLTNAHLEAWGPFGRGWSLKRFSAQVIEPQTIPLIGFPKAWSPGLEEPLSAKVVWLDAKNDSEVQKYQGKLKGAIVLNGPPRELKAHFEPLATRLADTNLLRLANAGEPTPGRPFGQANTTNSGRFAGRQRTGQSPTPEEDETGTNSARSARTPQNPGGPRGRPPLQPRFLSFL